MGASVSHFGVVDAIEDDTVVLLVDNGPKLLLGRKFFPPGTKESTVLKITLEIDEAEHDRRVAQVTDLATRLMNRTRGQQK